MNPAGKKAPAFGKTPVQMALPQNTRTFTSENLKRNWPLSGYTRKPHETYEQFFMRIREKAFPPQEIPSLTTVIRIHKQLRFGPHPVSGKELALLESETDKLCSRTICHSPP